MKTIRGRLTLVISIGIVGVILLSVVTVNKTIDKRLEKDIKKDMDVVLNYSKENLENAIILEESKGKFTDLNKIINIFEGYAYFEDSYGVDYAGKYKDLDALNSYKEKIDRDNGKGEKSYLKIAKVEGLVMGTLYYPLYINEEFKGTLILQRDYTENYNSYGNIRNNILVCQLVLMGALIGALYLFIKKTTRPLEGLTKKIKAFGNGEKLDIEIMESNDEIGVISREFDHMEENIITLQKESKEFFDRATHELKTPLTGIKGYSDLLMEEAFEDEFVITAIERIGEESDKMTRLIKNLLVLSKRENSINVYKERVNVKGTIDNIIKSMELKIRELDLEIEKNIKVEEIEVFKSDFEVILNNLITNSIKYTYDGRININLEYKDRYILKIKNGIKDREDFEKDVFAPFVKREGIKDEISSSGLGLYICKRICKKNNWNIEYTVLNNEIEFTFEF